MIQQVDCLLPTTDQKAAMDHAHTPNKENPFATLHDLPGGPNDPVHVLTDDEIAAIRASQIPSGGNPFITQNALPPPQLTPAQKAALDAAKNPNGGNPFITQSALPEPQLTEQQKAAVDAADNPHGGNPFITQSALPKPELTPEQKAAINTADNPNGNNPFITKSALPLSEEQIAALGAADNPHAGNPFITQSALPKPQLTAEQEAAVDAADNPRGDNPFITKSALPLNEEQIAAIHAADHPHGDNPFITQSALPKTQLTEDQKDALDAANQPTGNNPLATMADLAQKERVSRVVAAGTLDLSGATASQTAGQLSVLSTDPSVGLATLSFASYEQNRKARYVVKSLPVSADARAGLQALTTVQFVEFTPQGFVLQMARPFADKKYALGPCMVEVSEIVGDMSSTPGNLLYKDDFSQYEEGANPKDWIDTGPNFSLEEVDLFRTVRLENEIVYGTNNTGVSIHSHYIGAGAHAWTNYLFTGQLRFSHTRGGIGVTFFSRFPNDAIYYSLRRAAAADAPFQLVGQPEPARAISRLTKDAKITPAVNIWYRFSIEVTHDPNYPHPTQSGKLVPATIIKAKVWPDGESEPTEYHYEGLDYSDPIPFGTIGIWTSNNGNKYVRNLVVARQMLAPS